MSSRRGVIASTIAVLPEPTGPPTPIRVIFFAKMDAPSGVQVSESAQRCCMRRLGAPLR
jgi:hypothetical protein